MDDKVIERIEKNTKSITLISNTRGIYSVTFKNGTTFKTQEFGTLLEALKYFNDLSEMFGGENG